MENIPFIHTFESPKEKYFYDFNTNAIVRVKEDVYSTLKMLLYQDTDAGDISKETMEKLQQLTQQGFLKTTKWKEIEHPSSKFLEPYLNSSLGSLTLQITQQCNLKCSYCPYSGSFYNREHNDRKMSFDIAKKAVDFYISHSYDMPLLQIGFYGGEPLIEFDLIKRLVEYIKDTYFGKEIKFRMTTNATLLTNDMIDYLMNNNFTLMLSLDGPKEYHDRNRHNINNTGSFDTILNNINNIVSKYPDLKENIIFNCVIDPQNNLENVNSFFVNHEMLKDYSVMFNDISREGIKDETDFLPDEQYSKQYYYELFKLLYSKTGKVKNINVSEIVSSYYEQIKFSFLKRSITGLTEDSSHPSGPCIPGGNKLFVNVYGKFYTCEKVNERSEDMIIGDVDTGFDISQIDKILNIGKLTSEQCKNCWCSKFCFVCVQHTDKGNGISKEFKLTHCNAVKLEVEHNLKDYCLLHEINGFEDDIIFLTN